MWTVFVRISFDDPISMSSVEMFIFCFRFIIKAAITRISALMWCLVTLGSFPCRLPALKTQTKQIVNWIIKTHHIIIKIHLHFFDWIFHFPELQFASLEFFVETNVFLLCLLQSHHECEESLVQLCEFPIPQIRHHYCTTIAWGHFRLFQSLSVLDRLGNDDFYLIFNEKRVEITILKILLNCTTSFDEIISLDAPLKRFWMSTHCHRVTLAIVYKCAHTKPIAKCHKCQTPNRICLL